jgi:sterol desaturase/sphingolipid hydroxylase (fatty acid hydroxylase superfamily)
MDWKTLALLSSLFFFGVLEYCFPFFNFEQSLVKRVSTNFILGLFNALITSLTTTALLRSIWQQTSWQGVFHFMPLPWFVLLILSILVLDAYMYFWHWLMHITPIGWRFHRIHHLDREMNISTAYRFHAIEVVASNFPKLFLIWLLGIQPLYLLIFEVIYTIELVFHHSNWALPYQIDRVLSYCIVTPNYHRLHHSQTFKNTQSNYASLLSFWDQICGTRKYPKSPELIKLGLPKETRADILTMLWLPFSGVWQRTCNE